MRRALGAGVLIFAALAATGCGLLGGGEPPPTQAPKAEIGPDNHVKGAIAKAVQPYAGKEVYVDVLSLQRHDKVLRLVYAVTPRAKTDSDALPKETFGGNWQSGNAGAPFLLDTENLRVYDSLTIGSGEDARCACSTGLGDYPLDQPTVLYADYPAPPKEVKELTIVMPVVGPMPGVKIS